MVNRTVARICILLLFTFVYKLKQKKNSGKYFCVTVTPVFGLAFIKFSRILWKDVQSFTGTGNKSRLVQYILKCKEASITYNCTYQYVDFLIVLLISL